MIDPAGISPWLVLVAPVVIVVAYTVFGLSGFGATAISVPILAHFLPVSYLVPLLVLLDMMSSGAKYSELRWSVPIHPTVSELLPTLLTQLKAP